jgi:hypothetical protein
MDMDKDMDTNIDMDMDIGMGMNMDMDMGICTGPMDRTWSCMQTWAWTDHGYGYLAEVL